MGNLKKILFILTVAFFVSNISLAQGRWEGPKPEIYKGAKAWTFTYSPFVSNAFGSYPIGNFIDTDDGVNYYEVPVAGIGFKYFVSPQMDVTVGLNFGSVSQSDVITTTDTLDLSQNVFGIGLDLNYHLRSLYSISPYAGLHFGLSHFGTSSEGQSGAETSYSSNGIQIGLNLGFDWYFTHGMSLGGRYTLAGNFYGSPESETSDGTTTTTVDGPSASTFGTGVASIFLNVHF